MRIVRLANFVAPRSGGLRTSLAELGAGYLAAGHEPVLVIPGERDGDERCAQGRVITLRAPGVPFTGGYRVLWRRRRLAALLAALRPDALEVSDRTTLRWTGAWAREHGVPAVMVSHESVTALLKLTWMGPSVSSAVADWLNRRTARAYHRVICTTGWAAAEFGRIGAGNVVRVPLGVDLDTFSPRGGAGQDPVRRPGPDPAGALRPALGGEEAAALADHAGHAARRGPAGPAGGGGRWPAAVAPGAPGRARRAAGHLRRFPARPRRPGRAAGQRRRGHRARAGGNLRAGRPGGAGLRDPGGGERGVRAARGGGRGRGQRGGRGPRGRRAGRARPAGTVPAGRRPRPRGAIRLGHGHPGLPRRSRGRGQPW